PGLVLLGDPGADRGVADSSRRHPASGRGSGRLLVAGERHLPLTARSDAKRLLYACPSGQRPLPGGTVEPACGHPSLLMRRREFTTSPAGDRVVVGRLREGRELSAHNAGLSSLLPQRVDLARLHGGAGGGRGGWWGGIRTARGCALARAVARLLQ